MDARGGDVPLVRSEQARVWEPSGLGLAAIISRLLRALTMLAIRDAQPCTTPFRVPTYTAYVPFVCWPIEAHKSDRMYHARLASNPSKQQFPAWLQLRSPAGLRVARTCRIFRNHSKTRDNRLRSYRRQLHSHPHPLWRRLTLYI